VYQWSSKALRSNPTKSKTGLASFRALLPVIEKTIKITTSAPLEEIDHLSFNFEK
jgi:hypothetical protein